MPRNRDTHDQESEFRPENYRRRLKAWARQILGRDRPGTVEVSDVVQDTLFAASQSSRALEGKTEEQLGAWLHTTLGRKIADRLRKAIGKGGLETHSLNQPKDDASARLSFEPVAEASTLSQKRVKAALRSVLDDAIEGLPERELTGFVLRDIDDHPLWEFAERMNTTPDAVHGLLDRARKRLREKMGSNDAERRGGDN